MKKIWVKVKDFFNRVGSWCMLHFYNTLIDEVEFDAYVVSFRRFTMEIKTKSNNVKLRTMCMEYPQSFLLHCLSQDDTKTIEWFCDIIYQFVSLITTDQGLANDVHKAFAKYYKRMEKKSIAKAKNISQDEDEINAGIIENNITYANLSKDERKEYIESMKEVLTEIDE